MSKTMHSLRLIGNLANRSAYEFSDADIKKMFRVLQRELDAAKSRFGEGESSDSKEFRL